MANENLNLQKFILSVVIVGISLIIGIYINSTIGTQLEATNYQVTIVNESGYINSSGYLLSKYNARDFANPTIVLVINATSNATITSANYTIVNNRLVNSTSKLWNTVKITYTYTFTNSTSASEAAENVTDALVTGTSWISILVVVGFAVIILTMLTSGLGQATKEQGAVPYY
jgi:flagellar biosynthesis protein FliP